MERGYISLYRKMLDWEWSSDPIVLAVYIRCLLKANWSDKQYKGITIHRGEFMTTQKELAEEVGISRQQLRSAIDKLITTNSITKWISPTKHTIIKVSEYEKYQNNQSINHSITNQQPISNQHTNNNNNNNIPPNNYIYNTARAREENEPRVIGHLNVKTSEDKKLFADKVKFRRA